MFNRQLENNPQQHAAVLRIVAGSSKPAPHLVFGPPGTGKTITLVEAMNQVLSVQVVLFLKASQTVYIVCVYKLSDWHKREHLRKCHYFYGAFRFDLKLPWFYPKIC